MAPNLRTKLSTQMRKTGYHPAISSDDSVDFVKSGLRLIQLSPTAAPSLLSTSASDPFSEPSRSEEVCGDSVLSFPTSAGASGGEGLVSGVTAGSTPNVVAGVRD
jgi:hypothetical protein